MPSRIASTHLSNRLRSSVMCSRRVIRPSSSFGRRSFRRPILTIVTACVGVSVGRVGRRHAVARRLAVHLVRLLGRSLGRRLGLSLRLLALGQLVALLATGADLFLPDLLRLAELAHQRRQLGRPEEQHDDREDDEPLRALGHTEERDHDELPFTNFYSWLNRERRYYARTRSSPPVCPDPAWDCACSSLDWAATNSRVSALVWPHNLRPSRARTRSHTTTTPRKSRNQYIRPSLSGSRSRSVLRGSPGGQRCRNAMVRTGVCRGIPAGTPPGHCRDTARGDTG